MWTEEKINFLYLNYSNTDNELLEKLLQINKNYIIKKANDLKLFKSSEYMYNLRKKNNPGVQWTKYEEEYLKNNYKTLTNKELSLILNKTKKSVIKKLKKMDLKCNKEEKDLLRSKVCKQNGRDLSYEFVKEIAKKYNTKNDFYINDKSAYSISIKNKWIDLISKHMISGNFSIPQLMLKDILEHFLKEKCIYNDRLTIKPLEIDCYFKKWNIGWEYNGIYYHTDEKDEIKNNLCKEKNIKLFIITEKTKDYKNYDLNIKNQIIRDLDIINDITKLNILGEDVVNYKINIIFPNILTDFEKEFIKNKQLSDIKKQNIVLYKKIIKYHKNNLNDLLIHNDIKKYNYFNNFEEYKTYLLNKKYNNFSEMCKYEHPHRLMKKWNLPISLIHKLF